MIGEMAIPTAQEQGKRSRGAIPSIPGIPARDTVKGKAVPAHIEGYGRIKSCENRCVGLNYMCRDEVWELSKVIGLGKNIDRGHAASASPHLDIKAAGFLGLSLLLAELTGGPRDFLLA